MKKQYPHPDSRLGYQQLQCFAVHTYECGQSRQQSSFWFRPMRCHRLAHCRSHTKCLVCHHKWKQSSRRKKGQFPCRDLGWNLKEYASLRLHTYPTVWQLQYRKSDMQAFAVLQCHHWRNSRHLLLCTWQGGLCWYWTHHEVCEMYRHLHTPDTKPNCVCLYPEFERQIDFCPLQIQMMRHSTDHVRWQYQLSQWQNRL